ncbi:unnamed protein product [Caenorhabditis brenneri]
MRNAEERKAENKKLIEFLSEKCEEAEEPLNLNKLIDEFIKKEEIKTPRSTLHSVVEVYRKKEILEIEEKETRVRQLFALGAKINNDVLEKLEEDAKVELDKKGRIIKYESNDGQLTLNGDHCVTKKIRETLEKQRRSRMIEQDEVDDEEERQDDHILDMGLDLRPEVHPPAPKKARVEDSGSAPEVTPAMQVRDQIPEEDAIVLDDSDEEENVQPNMQNIEVKIEDPEVQEDIKQEFLEPFGEGNQLGPNLDMVKQEVPEPEDFQVKIESPEATVTNSASRPVSTSTTNNAPNLSAEQPAPPRMNIVRTEEPDSRRAPNSARQARSAAPVVKPQNGPVASPATSAFSSTTQPAAPIAPGAARILAAQNPPPTLPETPGPSSSTEPPAPTGVSTVTAPEQSTAPTDSIQEQQPQTNGAPKKPMLPNATQLEILKSLEAIIGIMDLPMDSSQIKDQIQKMTAGEKLDKIEMDDMKKTIDYFIVVAKMNRKSEGETRSLKDFLKLVQFTVVKDRFEQVQKELKEELETLKKNDKLVPVSNITMAVEVIVRILVSN